MAIKSFTKIVVATVSLTLATGFFATNSSAQMYEDYGIFIDLLNDNSCINSSSVENCQLVNGSIMILQTPGNFTYDFSTNNFSKAWCRNNAPVIFNPIVGPDILLQQEFTMGMRENISYLGDGRRVINHSTFEWLVPLHHFRFQLNVSRGAVDEIHFFWNGSCNSDDGIRVFAWRYLLPSTTAGWWTKLKSTNETSVDVVIYTDPQSYISDGNYIDFVVTPYRTDAYSRTCISTDYVSLEIAASGRATRAKFDTLPVKPESVWMWECVTWNGSTPPGTSIKCQVLNESGGVIGDEIIDGNEKGFTKPPVTLHPLFGNGYDQISLRFHLETNDPTVTPTLFYYAILWQPLTSKWQDRFPVDPEVLEITDLRIENQTSDYLISTPVYLPESYWWDEFHATVNLSEGGGINFNILDFSGRTLMSNVTPGDKISSLCTRVIRLRADFVANETENPKLEEWTVTFKKDKWKPEFRNFYPTSVGQPTVDFTIQVKDSDSGLYPSSASYRLVYNVNGSMRNSTWLSASCFSENCTDCIKEWQTLTATDVSVFYSSELSKIIETEGETNVTLYSIQFSIEDMAGNIGYSNVYKIKIDTTPPSSEIVEVVKEMDGNVTFHAEATDDAQQVKLYYVFSFDNQTFQEPEMFGVDDNPPWEWSFEPVVSGYYRFYSIAVDSAGNSETPPGTGDVTLLIDNIPPDKPDFTATIYWLSSPNICCINFTDDFMVSKIEYSLNGNNYLWREIASNVDNGFYNKEWSLHENDWGRMDEGEIYYIYFRVTDKAGNIYETPGNNEAFQVAKDTTPPKAYIEKILEWQWKTPLTITSYAIDKQSNITNVTLLYRHSLDNKSWSNWTVYGSVNEGGTYRWSFDAPQEGYYEFKVEVRNGAGKKGESGVVATGVTVFPMVQFASLISIFVTLLFTTIIAVRKWKMS